MLIIGIELTPGLNELKDILSDFNVEAYLDHCLESVQIQDHDNIEVIGIDDASTDGSRQVFERYLDDTRFELLTHPVNLGLPSARNTGLLRARGSYVYFLDSDDWISPDCLSKLLSMAVQDGSEITIGGALHYFEDSKQYAVPRNHGHLMRNPVRGQTIFEGRSPFHSTTSWNKLISLDYLKSTGLQFKSVPRRFEDVLTYKWYLSGARISSTPDVTYFYRQRDAEGAGASIMQSRSLSVVRDKLLAFADLLRYLKSTGFFRTPYDPLDSPNSMLKLPLILQRMIRETFGGSRELCLDSAHQDDFLAMMLAFKELLLEYTDEEAEALPDNVRNFRRLLMTRPVMEAADQMLKPGKP